MPSPGGALYSAGKAFLSAFAASIAIEARRASFAGETKPITKDTFRFLFFSQ